MTPRELLEQLDFAGADAMSDFNDGLEPDGGWFGWDVGYENGFRVLTVEFQDAGERDEYDYPKSYIGKWALVPMEG